MKNRMEKMLISALASGMIFSSSAFAFEAVYSPENDSVKINGENNAEMVAIAVMPYKYTINDLNREMVSAMSDIMFVSIPAGGEYAEEILLSDAIGEGKYRICENIDGGIKDSVFIRMKADALEALIGNINGADKSVFISKTKEFIESLSVDLPEEGILDLAEKLYEIKPASGYTEQSFYKAFLSAEGLIGFKYSKVTLSDYFEEYSVCIENDIMNDYKNMSEAQKTESENCASGIVFKNKSVPDILEEILLKAKVCSAVNWSQMKTDVEKYCTENSISTPVYNSLMQSYQKDNVFIKLFDERKNITNTEYLISRIEAIASSVKNSPGNNPPSTGGGGGGGNSGSSRPALSGNPVTPNTDSGYDEKVEVFSDIADHWAKADIEKMNSLKFVNGFEDKTFRPDVKVTRAEFVKMISAVLNLPDGANNSFEDVSDNDWFKPYVSSAVMAGIVSGISDTHFAPYNEITRQDATVMVYRAIKDKLLVTSMTGAYNDEDSISDYAKESVMALTESGIMKGSDGYFHPKNGITRAEAAVLLLRVHSIV